MSPDTIDNLLGLGTFLVTLAGLGGVYVQIRNGARAQQADHDRQRRQATLDSYVGSFDSRSARWAKMPNDRDSEAVRTFCPDPSDTDHEHFTLVVDHLNMYENLATGALFGVYDLEILEALVGSRLVAAWHSYEPFIKGRRQLMSSALGGSNVWCDLETVALKFEARAKTAKAPVWRAPTMTSSP